MFYYEIQEYYGLVIRSLPERPGMSLSSVLINSSCLYVILKNFKIISTLLNKEEYPKAFSDDFSS